MKYDFIDFIVTKHARLPCHLVLLQLNWLPYRYTHAIMHHFRCDGIVCLICLTYTPISEEYHYLWGSKLYEHYHAT